MSTLSKASCSTPMTAGVLNLLFGPLGCNTHKTFLHQTLSSFKPLYIFNSVLNALWYFKTVNAIPLANRHLEMLV